MGDKYGDVPIKRLHTELLSLIFLENTFPSCDITRLDTALSSSQVCQQWRDIVISFSPLWGRLIDMDRLNIVDINDPWRNEVLKRSGSALLWIRGYAPSEEHYETFLLFLEENWTRIERMNISGYEHRCPSLDLRLTRRDGSQYSGLNLKSLALNRMEILRDYSLNSMPIPFLLFMESAPRLRQISTGTAGIKFDPHSRWLPNITDLTLMIQYTVQEIFEILGATPMLTSLDIILEPRPSPARPVSNINLPFLETFAFAGHFLDVVPFFRSLDLPASCTLHINLDVTLDHLQNEGEALVIIRDEILKRIQKHLNFCAMTRMVVYCSKSPWEVSFTGAHATGVSSLCLNLRALINIDPTMRILEDLSLCSYLPPVTEMSLIVATITSESAYLTHLVSCSRSLTTLETEDFTLEALLYANSTTSGGVYFPSLQVLRIIDVRICRYGHRCPYPTIGKFLHMQVEGGCPVSLLDFTDVKFRSICDMEYLDQVPGLKIVKWYDLSQGSLASYECGSGHPEVLRVQENYLSKITGGYYGRNRKRIREFSGYN